jgi:hypothetical protein
MYSYFAYGLGIRSALQLPELERAGSMEGGISNFGLRIANLGKSQEHGARSLEQGVGERSAKSEEQRAGSEEEESKGPSAKSEAQKPIRNPKSAIRNVSPDLRPLISDLSGTPDVEIRFGRVERLPSGGAGEGSYFRSSSEETQLFWEDVGTIQLRGGREVIIDPLPGAEEALLRLVILGPALGALLQQRGLLVLHASAVAMADGAVAFLGEKGWGKSTIAAAFYSRGYGIAADDIAAIDAGTGCPMLEAGFPQLKLWPDTAVSLGDALETLPRVHSQSNKRACRVDRDFPQTALPLKAIYVLAQGTTPKLEPLPLGNAFLELARHSYRAELLGASGASSHFLQCASVTKSTSIRYLRTSRSLALLPDVARLVEEDITHDIYRNTGRDPAS